jgi:hypothetical protein
VYCNTVVSFGLSGVRAAATSLNKTKAPGRSPRHLLHTGVADFHCVLYCDLCNLDRRQIPRRRPEIHHRPTRKVPACTRRQRIPTRDTTTANHSHQPRPRTHSPPHPESAARHNIQPTPHTTLHTPTLKTFVSPSRNTRLSTFEADFRGA